MSLKNTARLMAEARIERVAVALYNNARDEIHQGGKTWEERSNKTKDQWRAAAKVAVEAAGASEERQIVIDLFAPEHFDGCMFGGKKGSPNLPCQCGYHGRRRRYDEAIEKAKLIAAGHDYLNDFREDGHD